MELKDLGLNKYESKAYQALLQGSCTANILSQRSRVPHGKIYPTLYSLKNKGFITIDNKKPKTFTAIEPKKTITKALKNKEKEFQQFQDEVNKITQTLGQMAGRRESEVLEKFRVIKGYKKYLNFSAYLHNQVKKEWFSISRLPVYKPHIDSYKEAIKKGIKIKLLVSHPDLKDENLKAWKAINANIRKIDYLQTRFSVIDGKEVVLRFSGGKEYIALWIKNESLAQSMRNYFLNLWKNGKKLWN
jgi:sugar-specific transcriptional regulator TrmB